jgi:hypothetical protein
LVPAARKTVNAAKEGKEAMVVITFAKVLAVVELSHAFSHVLVLHGYQQVFIQMGFLTTPFKVAYFSYDMLCALTSFYITRKRPVMTCIHFAIHTLALLFLLARVDVLGSFYKDVFHMAEAGYESHWGSTNMAMYVAGTLQDVSLHLLNAKDLLAIDDDSSKNKNKEEHEQQLQHGIKSKKTK